MRFNKIRQLERIAAIREEIPKLEKARDTSGNNEAIKYQADIEDLKIEYRKLVGRDYKGFNPFDVTGYY